MKALCSRCGHIIYTFDEEKAGMSPEILGSQGCRVVCPFHGADCISAPGDEVTCNCSRCTRERILKERVEFAKTRKGSKFGDDGILEELYNDCL